VNRLLRPLLLVLLLWLPLLASAQQTAEKSEAYRVHTGDAWVDSQLQDINHYAERYPDSFLDEVSRYAGVSRGYIAALMYTHGWQAGDIYFACFWAKATEHSCRDTVQAWSRFVPEEGEDKRWADVVAEMPVTPSNLHWRALRHAIVASHDHWDRPITLDATLKRQLGDRAQRDRAAANPAPAGR
jgi:hypothetical protein